MIYEKSLGKSDSQGLDSAIIPLNNNNKNLYLVQSVDFFYPLCDDANLMGKIAFANVVSDIYSCGVADIDEVKIILSMPDELNEEQQQQVANDLISGFRESAKLIKCRLTLESININPWCMIGGIATSICTKDELVFPTGALPGDAIILTKPLGVQLATNAKIWLDENSESWKKLSQHLTEDDVKESYEKALKSMVTLNHLGAKLMQKYKAHCATDVTGFGIIGHAENLIEFQEQNVNFVINKMPLIKHVKKMSEILNRTQKMLNGKMVETSGGLFLCLPSENAQAFCDDFFSSSGDACWIIGRVEKGDKKVLLENVEFIEI
ncbi:hypothetical protein PVAND_016917 [Polypedilum vanderplanki]|uniref:Selenophosphate synthetase n=1 Tax=Polypedilum vanderplanki TaxID=319348 RepID=A0A9J6BHT4_POLVA|nr:hypothetical protein PVAND_016917 [Polypedilum vanderplanki]